MTGDGTDPTPMDPPPGWDRTDRPLRVAILGWARLWAQAREGSGYNLVASELAMGLSMRGHRVWALRSGMEYSARPGMRIRHDGRWCGVSCWRLVNSPNLSPAAFNFRNMDRERRSPAQTRLVVEWLDRIRADVVHVHSLEGYGLDLLPAIARSGRAVVVTPHNYWFVCPQVDLLQGGVRVCTDFEGGRRCVGCVDAARPGRARLRRTIEQTGARLGPIGVEIARAIVRTKDRLALGVDRNGTRPSVRDRRRGLIDPPIDPDLALGLEALDEGRADTDGLLGAEIPIDPEELEERAAVSPIDQNERLLGATHHLRVLNGYGARRVEGIEALGAASAITPPSEFVARVHERMGADPERIRVVRLGLPHLDRITRRAARASHDREKPWDPERSVRPLRVGFFGTVRANKGLGVLVEAIGSLEPSVRRRCHFVIRAGGGDWVMRRKLARYPEVSFLGGYDLLHLNAAGGEFDVGILPAIWFENSPVVLLEYLHAGKFVIASRLGGPPEWIIEPGSALSEGYGGLGNGLLFPGGDHEALADRITRIVSGRVELPSPEVVRRMTPMRSYPEYVFENERVYRGVVEGLGSGAERGGRAEASMPAVVR